MTKTMTMTMTMTMTKPVLVAGLLAVMAWPGDARSQTRPEQLTVGIGAGLDLPSEVTQIGVASVRLRLPIGLTIEPRVELASASQSLSGPVVDTENSTRSLVLAGIGRYTLISSGPVDFLVLGGLELGFASDNPEGPNNNTSASTFAVTWGVSVEYWIAGRWTLSLGATNPLFSRLQVTQQGDPDDTSTTTSGFGIIFDPDVDVMVHLYF